MKKLLNWGAVAFLTTAMLDPLVCSMLEKPVPWGRDLIMGLAGIGCIYFLVKYRREL